MTEHLVPERHHASDFHQVTNVRFLSMVTIVAMHAQFFSFTPYGGFLHNALFQVIKFGTIGFFMVGGFLLGHKLSEVHPAQYFRRRLRSTFRPWLFWAGVYSVIATIKPVMSGEISLKIFKDQIINTLFYSNYWFVINFLFALGILLLFRKHFQNLFFFITLLIFSLFYGVNLYFAWVPSNHTTAVLGYAFYIWLGIQVNLHRKVVFEFMDALRWRWVILIVLAVFGIAILEASYLFGKNPDFLSSLRISNQLYSVVIFFALFKISHPINPRWMNVRHETYGIHLIHWLILDRLKPLIAWLGGLYYHVSESDFLGQTYLYMTSPILRFTLWMITFFTIYLSAWYCTHLITKTRFAWLVGVTKTGGDAVG